MLNRLPDMRWRGAADLRLVTPPTAEPITLAEARRQARVDADPNGTHEDDPLLLSLITAAREAAERYTGRIFTNAIYELRVDAFASRIELPVAPVRRLLPVAYRDPEGDLVEFMGVSVLHDHPYYPSALLYGQWPATDGLPGAVQIRFQGAYGPGGQPLERVVVQAMLLTIEHLYENRADVSTAQTYQLVNGSKSLLQPFRRNYGA